jgi:hypothetical protein
LGGPEDIEGGGTEGGKEEGGTDGGTEGGPGDFKLFDALKDEEEGSGGAADV